jgi:chromosome segregation ATPase
MAGEFEQMKERCLEREEKKKSTYSFMEQKEAELQGLEVALLKVGADIEIEEHKATPLSSMLTEANTTSTRIKSQIQDTLTAIDNTTRKLNSKSEAIMTSIRDSLLRGYAICSHLRAASKTDPLEQVIIAQLTNPQTHRLREGMQLIPLWCFLTDLV